MHDYFIDTYQRLPYYHLKIQNMQKKQSMMQQMKKTCLGNWLEFYKLFLFIKYSVM